MTENKIYMNDLSKVEERIIAYLISTGGIIKSDIDYSKFATMYSYPNQRTLPPCPATK